MRACDGCTPSSPSIHPPLGTGSLGQGGYGCNYTFKAYNNKHPLGGGGGGGYYGGGGGCNAGGGGGSSYCSFLCSSMTVGLVSSSTQYFCNPQGYALVTPIYNIPNIITTYAGTGYNLLNSNPVQKLGDGGSATSASFNYPFGVAVDSSGDFHCEILIYPSLIPPYNNTLSPSLTIHSLSFSPSNYLSSLSHSFLSFFL